MKDTGRILKQARENKKISLKEAHKNTRIKESYIVALENNDISVFPAELYYKNFLKTYAKFLDLKPEELLNKYELSKKEEIKEEIKKQIKNTSIAKKSQKKLVITFVFSALMCAGLIAAEFLLQHQPAPEQTVENINVSVPNPLPDEKQKNANLQQKQKISIEAFGKTWISINADNKKIFEDFINRGENKIFFADSSFLLTIGNVLNVAVYFNDKKIDIVSGSNKNNVNTITLKKENNID